jgi:CheY-like chemotaxis protein
VEIKDDGAGIPAEVRDKIFEPFFTTKEVGKGTGLGLSTVAAIVKNHGGFVNVYSEIGRGTSFKIYFPAVPGEGAQQAVARAESAALGHGEMILIVDDEAAVRDIAKVILETHGYNVVTAEDGADGVARYAQHRDTIRLVISDSDMPILNGAAMVQSIRRMNPDVRVIAASGLSENRAPESRQTEAVLQLPKPFTAIQLLTAVRSMIEPS